MRPIGKFVARGITACAILWATGFSAALAQPLDWETAVRQGERALHAGDYDEAEQLFSTAASLAREFPASDPRLTRSLIGLARVYRAEGDLAKPEQLYREASLAASAAYGDESAEYARLLNEVGRYYHTRRKYEIAERFYREAFGARLRLFGREHLEVAESIADLAVLYENLTRHAKSETYYQTALDIRRKLLGDEHPRTIETREHFARLLHKMQKSAEAQAMQEAARKAREPLIAEVIGPPVDLGEVASVGSGVEPPELVEQTEPVYTEEARIARQEGSVLLRVEIDAEGRPRNFEVVRMLGLGLDERAIEAARNWKFRPAKRRGEKIPFRTLLEINFTLL